MPLVNSQPNHALYPPTHNRTKPAPNCNIHLARRPRTTQPSSQVAPYLVISPNSPVPLKHSPLFFIYPLHSTNYSVTAGSLFCINPNSIQNTSHNSFSSAHKFKPSYRTSCGKIPPLLRLTVVSGGS